MGPLAEKQRNNRIAIKRVLFRILSRTVFGHDEGRSCHVLNFRHCPSLPLGDVQAVASGQGLSKALLLTNTDIPRKGNFASWDVASLLYRDEALQLPSLFMAFKTVDEIDLDLRVRKPRFGEPIH